MYDKDRFFAAISKATSRGISVQHVEVDEERLKGLVKSDIGIEGAFVYGYLCKPALELDRRYIRVVDCEGIRHVVIY